jgi:flagellar biosynthesis component FlhA
MLLRWFLFVLFYFLFVCLFVRCIFSRGHTLHVFHLCFVPVLFSFVIFVVSLRVFCLTNNKERTSRQTHTQENKQNNERKQHRNKTQMENMQSVTT